MQKKDQEQVSAKVYSERVNAGRRTYFFDIRTTKNHDFFLTITELKRSSCPETPSPMKCKLFLYKEDFTAFMDAFKRVAEHMKTVLLPSYDFSKTR